MKSVSTLSLVAGKIIALIIVSYLHKKKNTVFLRTQNTDPIFFQKGFPNRSCQDEYRQLRMQEV